MGFNFSIQDINFWGSFIIPILISVVTSYIGTRLIRKANNKHYYKDHQNELRSQAIQEAPDLQIVLCQHFLSDKEFKTIAIHKVQRNEMPSSSPSASSPCLEYTIYRKMGMEETEKQIKSLGAYEHEEMQNWVIVIIRNQSAHGLQINSLSLEEGNLSSITAQNGTAIRIQEAVAYLFPRRDFPEFIRATYRNVDIRYDTKHDFSLRFVSAVLDTNPKQKT